MSIILLSGPAASGKNTIAQELCQRRERAADIDVDIVRWMYRNPHYAPWDGNPGMEQMRLGVENACLLAQSFSNKKIDVFITDVVLNETIDLYRQKISGVKIVQLMPKWEVVLQRLNERSHTITEDEALWVFDQQVALHGYDYQIDSSDLSVSETVEAIERWLSGTHL